MVGVWNHFLNSARVDSLKNVLRQLALSTAGSKAALKIRLQQTAEDFQLEQLLEFIPQYVDAGANGVGDKVDDQGEEGEDESEEEDEDKGHEDTDDDHQANQQRNVDEELQNLRNLVAKKREIVRVRRNFQDFKLRRIR